MSSINTQTVQQIAAAAAALIGLPPSLEILSNAGFAAQMRILLQDAGEELVQMRGPFLTGWTALTKLHTVQLVEGQEAYALPDDYGQIVPETLWLTDTLYRPAGSLSPQDWRLLKSQLGVTTVTPRWRIQAGQLYFDEPAAAQATFEYVSRWWLCPSAGVDADSQEITARDQVPVFDARVMRLALIWRWKQARNLPFQTDYELAMRTAREVLARDVGNTAVTIGGGDLEPEGQPAYAVAAGGGGGGGGGGSDGGDSDGGDSDGGDSDSNMQVYYGWSTEAAVTDIVPTDGTSAQAGGEGSGILFPLGTLSQDGLPFYAQPTAGRGVVGVTCPWTSGFGLDNALYKERTLDIGGTSYDLYSSAFPYAFAGYQNANIIVAWV